MEPITQKLGSVKIISMDETTATVGGYGVVFGGYDLEGDTFRADTDYNLPLVPVKMVFYDHSLGDVTHDIGRVTNDSIKMDDKGLWIEAQLDRSAEYVDQVLKLIEDGVMGWSSGSVAHLARKGAGYIKSWPIVEFSLTPTPAEPRTLGVERIKALAMVSPNLEALIDTGRQPESNATVDEPKQVEVKTIQKEDEIIMSDQDATPTPDNSEVLAAIAGIAESTKALGARLEAIENKPVNELKPDVKSVNINTVTYDTGQYDNTDTGALALAASVVKAAGKHVPDELYKAIGLRLEGDNQSNRGSMSAKSFSTAAHAFKSFSRGVKANELHYSTQSGAVDEWIGVAYSGELWDLIRNETMVLRRLGSPVMVPRGAESVTIPTLTGGVTYYKVAEATSMGANPGATTNTVKTSKQTVSNASLTLATMGAGVTWTGEVDHGSVVNHAEQLRRDLVISGSEYMEAIFINGDTDASATTNINDIGGTPAANDWFLITNGFRKSPLITTTANSRAGGSLTSADFLETVKLMGEGGRNALDTTKVGFIVDPATHYKALQLADVKTRDVFNGATIESGRLTGIYGYSVDVSAEMHKGATGLLANTSGLVDLDTQANNTTGSILAVRWDQWQWGHSGEMTIEAERVPRANATEITALTRIGLIQRDTEASAISYGLTI